MAALVHFLNLLVRQCQHAILLQPTQLALELDLLGLAARLARATALLLRLVLVGRKVARRLVGDQERALALVERCDARALGAQQHTLARWQRVARRHGDLDQQLVLAVARCQALELGHLLAQKVAHQRRREQLARAPRPHAPQLAAVVDLQRRQVVHELVVDEALEANAHTLATLDRIQLPAVNVDRPQAALVRHALDELLALLLHAAVGVDAHSQRLESALVLHRLRRAERLRHVVAQLAVLRLHACGASTRLHALILVGRAPIVGRSRVRLETSRVRAPDVADEQQLLGRATHLGRAVEELVGLGHEETRDERLVRAHQPLPQEPHLVAQRLVAVLEELERHHQQLHHGRLLVQYHRQQRATPIAQLLHGPRQPSLVERLVRVQTPALVASQQPQHQVAQLDS